MESVYYICLMKICLLFILLFTSFFCCSAQKSSKDTVYFKDFSYAEMTQWDSIERLWTQKYLQPFFKKYKIKISCAGCSRFVMDIYFEVKEDGTCKPTLVSVQKCHVDLSKKQSDELSKLLLQLKFTSQFYNRNLRLTISRVLKC